MRRVLATAADDWLAVYRCTDGACEANSEYLVWIYTKGANEGSIEIGPDAKAGQEIWPLPAGK